MASCEQLISEYTNILAKHGITHEIEKIIHSTPPLLVGQHMASICEYVTVQFVGKESPKHFFWKRKLLNPNPKIDAAMGRLIIREGLLLTTIAKEMSDLWCRKYRDSESTKMEQLFPFVYHVDETNIVMENMTYTGYRMLNKMEQQDLNQAKLVLENLAILHGTSYALIRECGGKFAFIEKYPELNEPMLNPGAEILMSRMFDPSFSGVLQLLKECPDERSQDAFAKLRNYDGKFASTYVQIIRSDNLLDVLNHGDCWNNNIMFSFGDNGENKLVFVDLQMARVSSPNVDISFYLFSTCQPRVRKQWKELLRFYFDSFIGILQNLEIPRPFNFQAFVEDFIEKAKIGFLFGVLMNACKGAIKNHSTSTSEGKIEDDFTRLFNIWITENPEEVMLIVSTVIEMLDDYELFGSL